MDYNDINGRKIDINKKALEHIRKLKKMNTDIDKEEKRIENEVFISDDDNRSDFFRR